MVTRHFHLLSPDPFWFEDTLFAHGWVRLLPYCWEKETNTLSRFEWLRQRPKDSVATPPMFMAFDCLQLDERDLRSKAMHVRRERLESVLDGAPAVLLPVRRLSDDGLKAWREVVEHGNPLAWRSCSPGPGR